MELAFEVICISAIVVVCVVSILLVVELAFEERDGNVDGRDDSVSILLVVELAFEVMSAGDLLKYKYKFQSFL